MQRFGQTASGAKNANCSGTISCAWRLSVGDTLGNHWVKLGARHMHTPDADYFRHQAATCLRLAQFCRDLEVARRLFGMAGEFKSKAAEMDAGLQTMTAPSIEASCGPARD
jgi:hypothetical protein